MANESKNEAVVETLRRINRAWLDDQIEDLIPLVHPEVVMTFPGFTGRIQGRDEFLAGFRDFRQNATIHEFREYDHRNDVIGDTAVATYRYEMVYERAGERYRATGRELWIFQNQNNVWIAVWRTMLDMEEKTG